MAVLRFPHVVGVSPERATRRPISQQRLRDLRERIAEWHKLGETIEELGVEIIADIGDGQLVEPGELKLITETKRRGPETAYTVAVESVARAILPLLLVLAG